MKQNKLFAVLLMLSVITLFSSCKKDDDVKIESWIIGTWKLDSYVQQEFKDGKLTQEEKKLNQGNINFKEGGVGEDFGGEFIGGDFTWSNTDAILTLVTGSGTTNYEIESFSRKEFVFSITDGNEINRDVERWYLSK